jgi:hypothetical protein
MKPSRIVWMFWIGNLVVLAALTAFLWVESTAIQEGHSDRDAAVADLRTREERVRWRDTDQAAPFQMIDTRLSPIERPRPPAPPVVQPPPPVKVEKTDDQLRDELEAALNKRFKLLRMMLSSSEEYPDIALVVADTARMQWFEGMNLKEEFAAAKSANLRTLALDLTITRIDAQGVLVDAASLEKPEKRFEILLTIHDDSLSLTMSAATFQPDGRALKLIEQPPEKLQPAPDWGYPMPKEQAREVEDLAKYTRATEHGVEILRELPADSPARKHGAQGGEIIKTINGEAVKSMSDIRRIVRTHHNAGTRAFKVGFERDGIPGEKVFTAPAKDADE